MLGDDHAAVDDPDRGAAVTGPVHTLPASWGVPKSGMGIERGLRAENRVQIRWDEAHRAPANGGATVIMVCREAWSAIGVVEPKGFPMDWSQCAS